MNHWRRTTVLLRPLLLEHFPFPCKWIPDQGQTLSFELFFPPLKLSLLFSMYMKLRVEGLPFPPLFLFFYMKTSLYLNVGINGFPTKDHCYAKNIFDETLPFTPEQVPKDVLLWWSLCETFWPRVVVVQNNLVVLWLGSRITRSWAEISFQPWYNPLWLTGLRALTSQLTSLLIY